jgi:hypothetical protein
MYIIFINNGILHNIPLQPRVKGQLVNGAERLNGLHTESS